MAETKIIDISSEWEALETPEELCEEVELVGDGLVNCLRKFGRVDISYIASVTGKNPHEVISLLKGSIYQDPETWDGDDFEGWVLADDYLSGNLLTKRKAARAASEFFPHRFEENIEALDKIMPCCVHFDDVELHPGMSFIETEIIDEYIEFLFGRYVTSPNFRGTAFPYKVKRDEITGSWEIPYKNRYRGWVTNISTYGTVNRSGMEILEDILNNRDTAVYYGSDKSAKRVVNKAATALALEKRKIILRRFDSWVKGNAEVRRKVERAYIREFGFIRRRSFNGNFIEKQWGNVTLYGYQRDAIARIILTLNCLLALPVGRGKTNIAIVSACEAIRMGLAKKVVFSVPNSILTQYREAFNELGCADNVYFYDTRDFRPDIRESVLEFIRNKETGIFVFTYSNFDMISLSEGHYRNELLEQLEKIKSARRFNKNDTAALKRKETEINKKIRDLNEKDPDEPGKIYFDDLGINMLYLDEAHNYKNVSIDSISHALGINKKGSSKCNRMMDKVHYIQKMNGGRGVVMITATPISNSMTDIYVFQKYLQSGELALHSINSFDAWINQFCQKSTEFEIDVDTSKYRLATRYSKFVNLPELTSMFASIAEFCPPREESGLPEFSGYTDVVIPRTAEFVAYLDEVSERCEAVRNGNVERDVDNMLKITVDVRKAALDYRLVCEDAPFNMCSKVSYCADRVYDLYCKTSDKKCAQLIFCDTSTPKAGFNIYGELKRLLTEMGIPANEIAFIHDADTEKKRETLFAKTREGEVRVLIGSTFKLGTGTNVQQRLIAIHNIDVPWRPSDVVQRSGRLIRQGNTNKKVYIFRYITENSFDAYSYQLLETKQRIISKILSGDTAVERAVAEIDESVLSYAEAKALAIGDPLIKERFATANELARYKALRAKAEESRIMMQNVLKELPARISEISKIVFDSMQDTSYLVLKEPVADEELRKTVRDKLSNLLRNKLTLKEELCVCSDYCGFKIIYPAYMPANKPFVWIERYGRYTVEMGEADKGIMIRIDNAIKRIPEIHKAQKLSRGEMMKKKTELESEIENINYYNEEIQFYTELLEDIERKLGVA